MVRVALAAVITLTAARASADLCSVAIPRAPDEVREEIEVWVRAEPRCSVELEVRVVPTEGGYYLFARDQQGRFRRQDFLSRFDKSINNRGWHGGEFL